MITLTSGIINVSVNRPLIIHSKSLADYVGCTIEKNRSLSIALILDALDREVYVKDRRAYRDDDG